MAKKPGRIKKSLDRVVEMVKRIVNDPIGRVLTEAGLDQIITRVTVSDALREHDARTAPQGAAGTTATEASSSQGRPGREYRYEVNPKLSRKFPELHFGPELQAQYSILFGYLSPSEQKLLVQWMETLSKRQQKEWKISSLDMLGGIRLQSDQVTPPPHAASVLKCWRSLLAISNLEQRRKEAVQREMLKGSEEDFLSAKIGKAAKPIIKAVKEEAKRTMRDVKSSRQSRQPASSFLARARNSIS